MEAHEKDKRGSEGRDEDFSDSNEFKGLAENNGKSIHGSRKVEAQILPPLL